MKIVTGHKGEDHVTSTDFQALNQGIFGSGDYVLEIGNKFAATMPDATHVVIQDGEGVMQGVHFRTERGTVDTVLIDSGATGVNRIDLVGALYEKDNEGVESVSWSVVKGTAVSGTPTEPTYATGDILAGDTSVFFPMYKVTFTGVTPELSKYRDYSPVFSLWADHETTASISLFGSGETYDGQVTPMPYWPLPSGLYIIAIGYDVTSTPSGVLKSIMIGARERGASQYNYTKKEEISGSLAENARHIQTVFFYKCDEHKDLGIDMRASANVSGVVGLKWWARIIKLA